MITYQNLKLISLICLSIHRCSRFLIRAVSMEWMARFPCLRMVYFLPPSNIGVYCWLGGALSSWGSIEGGRTCSMVDFHDLRTLLPPWLLCFAWKPKVRTVWQSCGWFKWWEVVLSRLLWCLNPGAKDISNLCSSNPISLFLEFWDSLELFIGIKYYPLSSYYGFNSSIIDLVLNVYINCKQNVKFHKSSSCVSPFPNLSSLLGVYNFNCSFCWIHLEVVMASKEKNKQKKSFKNTLLNRSDHVSSIETNNDGPAIKPKSSSLLEEVQQTGNGDFQTTKTEAFQKLEKGDSSKMCYIIYTIDCGISLPICHIKWVLRLYASLHCWKSLHWIKGNKFEQKHSTLKTSLSLSCDDGA